MQATFPPSPNQKPLINMNQVKPERGAASSAYPPTMPLEEGNPFFVEILGLWLGHVHVAPFHCVTVFSG